MARVLFCTTYVPTGYVGNDGTRYYRDAYFFDTDYADAGQEPIYHGADTYLVPLGYPDPVDFYYEDITVPLHHTCDETTATVYYWDGDKGYTTEVEEDSPLCAYNAPACTLLLTLLPVDGDTIDATVTGAKGQVSYTVTGRASQAQSKFTGLAPGTYTYTATDAGAANCVRTQPFTIGAGGELDPPTGAPERIDFSLNPIWHSVTGTHVLLELYVEQEHYGAVYRKVVTQRKRPSPDGQIHFRLDAILHPLLSAFVPDPAEDATTRCTSNVRNYFVRTAELDATTQLPGAFITSELRTVLRGAVPLELGDFDYFAYRLQAELPSFLTWQPRQKTITAAQPEWLSWLLPEQTPLHLVICRRYTDADGTATLEQEPLELEAPTLHQLLAIPVRAGHVAGATTVAVWIADEDETVLSEQWTYQVQPETARSRYFLFSNSLSGVDTLRTEGRLSATLDVKEDVAEHPLLPGRSLLGRQSVAYQEAARKLKVSVGWPTAEQFAWLQELLFAREIWQQQGQRLLPVQLLKKSLTYQEDDAGLRGYTFEYDYAFPALGYASPR
jgi:hypothetical protein